MVYYCDRGGFGKEVEVEYFFNDFECDRSIIVDNIYFIIVYDCDFVSKFFFVYVYEEGENFI